MRQITVKYATHCATCGCALPMGAAAHYDHTAARGSKMTCPKCYLEQTPAPAQPAASKRAKCSNVLHQFDSLADMLTAARQPIPQEHNRAVWEQLENMTGTRWLGVPDHAAVERAIESGWEDGVKKMREAFTHLAVPAPRSIRRKMTRGDYGDEYDIHAALAGRHESAWTRRVRRATMARRCVTVVSMVSALAQVSPEQMFWRGAAALAIADALTTAGYDVQIIGQTWSDSVYESKYSDAAVVTIKPFTAPLDLPALAASLCLAGMFRHVSFRLKCTHPIMKAHVGMGRTIYRTHPRILEQYPDALIVPEQCFSQSDAQAWVTTTLAQFAE